MYKMRSTTALYSSPPTADIDSNKKFSLILRFKKLFQHAVELFLKKSGLNEGEREIQSSSFILRVLRTAT